MRRVDADYTPNAMNGNYVMGRNRDGRCFNLNVLRDGVRRVIPMADPSALVINDANGVPWVYVIGTSDWALNANLCVYKSKDLINWEPHATAFSEVTRQFFLNQTGPFPAPNPADTLSCAPEPRR